ncbi:TetR/AcrR family transcriptional regulator [Halobellus limi]|jgi:AcrR family transcriptional regulator|uniref:TetR/AcrR family transcriptional regulator n=1 Tax=Halobellus limi TaxID=699433 RepID=A0A1H5TZD5_9EURY|nr:TetR/AcrR family transcriptional regulator [Halobellus limi]QCC47189.1 TetR/AcrR family transcriptional regulator [Halobellus limi]SEF68166.1 transcriptional regulator, TetR family [Halobellus limi]
MSEPDGSVETQDTREVIMEATFRALRKHGYSDLRVRDIGAEMDLSRQVIHYHFDGKYDLLSSFLEYVIDQYEGSIAVDEETGPREELEMRIDRCLFGPEFAEFSHWERMEVYHELYASAQHDEAHRELFTEHYDRLKASIVDVIERGIEAGAFRDVDADLMGQHLTDTIHVARERRLALGHDDAPEEARRAIEEFVLDSLYDGSDEAGEADETAES